MDLKLSDLLSKLKDWGERSSVVDSILLVGSHARNSAGPDSDIDVVIISTNPEVLLSEQTWVHSFG